MGTSAYKQPNGLLGLFSTCSDSMWAWDCTPEEAWTYLVFHYMMTPGDAAKSISAALNPEGHAAQSRDLGWESRIDRVQKIHGQERADELRLAGQEEVEPPAFSKPLFSTLDGLMLGEPGSTEPDPEWRFPEYLYDLTGTDETDVQRQWHKMTGGIHLSDDPSEVSMTRATQ